MCRCRNRAACASSPGDTIAPPMYGRSAQTPSHRSQSSPAGTGSAFGRLRPASPHALLLQVCTSRTLPIAPSCTSFTAVRYSLLRVNLDAHLRDQLLLPGHLRQPPALVQIVRERLLPIDVQPALQRRHARSAHACDPAWRHSPFAGPSPSPAARGNPDKSAPRETSSENCTVRFEIHIARRHHAHRGMRGDGRQIRPRHARSAKRSVIDARARRLREQAAGDEGRGGGAGGELFEKGTASQHGGMHSQSSGGAVRWSEKSPCGGSLQIRRRPPARRAA